MRTHADERRLLLGFHGLALLRDWPMGDPDIADAHIRAMGLLIEGAASGERVIDDAGLAAAYDAWATTYDDEPNGLIDVEGRLVAELVHGVPAGRAVDVACGTGRHAGMLASLGHDVVGVDRSAAMLAAARAKPNGARFVLGDARALPLADRCADLAVCGLALTHVRDLTVPIAEMARVVRPGGRIIVTDIHPVAAATGAQALPARADGTLVLARNEVHWPSAYVAAYRAAGLEVERLEEPLVDRAFLDSIEHAPIREALEATLGLPVALVWMLRKARDR